jgi:hypothetical protein
MLYDNSNNENDYFVVMVYDDHLSILKRCSMEAKQTIHVVLNILVRSIVDVRWLI